MVQPTSSLVICALPRSGSSLLGHLLYSSGVVGWPGEWFWRDEMSRNREAWGVSTWRDYLARAVEAGTASNGVFAVKLMWGYVHELLFELRRLAHEYDADDLTVLRSFFPRPRFVWVRRRDTVAQAVSWAKAAQTDQWAAHQSATGEPSFDFELIDGLYHLARVHDGAWQRWFAAHSIEPFQVVYEELCADSAGVTLEVLSFVGLKPQLDRRLEPPPELTKQADEINVAWASRYRELAGD